MKKEILIISATILLSVIILGLSYFAVQYNKQESIEKQVKWKLEQTQKEYISKRKMECYEIEEREREQWNNIDDGFYREEDDVCVVRYENKKWKEGNPFFSGLVDTNGDGVKNEYKDGKYFTKEY